MHILQVNKFKELKGGSETHFLGLIELLKNKGHQVSIFTMEDIGSIDFNVSAGWWDTLKKGWNVLWSYKAAKKLEELIRLDRPDVAHLHNFAFQLSPSIIWMLKKYQIPIVWTMHDYKLICPNYKLYTQGHYCERCKKYKYYNCVKYRCLKNSWSMSLLAAIEMYLHRIILKSYDKIDLLISPSEFLKNKCEQWGINPQKIKLLRYFLKLADFTPNFQAGNYVLYYGRLNQEKGVSDLLAAAKALPQIKFKIAGQGELAPKIKGLTNVDYVGFKRGEELKDLIRQSALVVVPSRWPDNNPFVIFEAMALGKPVIGSDQGGIPELIFDNQTGFIFKAGQVKDLSEKINLAFNSDLTAMGQKAHEFVAKTFDQEQFYNQLIKIYEDLIG